MNTYTRDIRGSDGITRTFTFKNVNGTEYHAETPDAVVNLLEYARTHNRRIRLFYGDTTTGRDWYEENYVIGYVGRSTGQYKCPLLINNARSLGGPAILDNCIVRIIDVTTKRQLYKHPLYHAPFSPVRPIGPDEKVATRQGELPVTLNSLGYFFAVDSGEPLTRHANFKTEKQAYNWLGFMTGARMCK